MAVLDSKGELTIYFSFICLIKKKRKRKTKDLEALILCKIVQVRERDRLSFFVRERRSQGRREEKDV